QVGIRVRRVEGTLATGRGRPSLSSFPGGMDRGNSSGGGALPGRVPGSAATLPAPHRFRFGVKRNGLVAVPTAAVIGSLQCFLTFSKNVSAPLPTPQECLKSAGKVGGLVIRWSFPSISRSDRASAGLRTGFPAPAGLVV